MDMLLEVACFEVLPAFPLAAGYGQIAEAGGSIPPGLDPKAEITKTDVPEGTDVR